MMGKPIIAIVNSFTQFVPGHTHLHEIGQQVKVEIEKLGCFAAEFNTIAIDDGIAMGHDGMLYSLPSRDIIADSVEYMVNAHKADAMVCISNCDKITPGMLMAAMRLNIPAVFVSGGPMEAGEWNNQHLDLIDAMIKSADASVSDEDVAQIENNACPGCGCCSGMFTANSMNCLNEAIGLGLDLKGGMNVILEVSVPDVVKALADNKTDEAFNKAVAEASKQSITSQDDFITLFVKEYKKQAPNGKLAELFATQQLKDKVTTRSSDSEVEKVIARGGKVLLIDQVFKLPHWSHDLRTCYERYPNLKIVFTGSSVMRLKDENPELNGIVRSYNLRGFSFREFLNLQTGNHFSSYSLEEILNNHEHIAKTILPHTNPLNYFQDYIHHGFYPFFLEKRNFSENLLKTMNMMIEVDILLIKQIELKYLSKIKNYYICWQWMVQLPPMSVNWLPTYKPLVLQ